MTIGGTHTLTISSTGLATGINISSGAGLTTINSNLELGYLSQVVDVNNTDGLFISGVISGTNGLTKTGAGVLTLTGVETYTGATFVSSGTLQLGDGITPGTSIASSDSVLVSPHGILAINLKNGETIGNSVTDSGQIRWIAQGTNTQAATSVFSGSGKMRVNARGTTILLGENTFSGGTIINTQEKVFVGNPLGNTSPAFGTGVLDIRHGTIDTHNSQIVQINVGGYIQFGGEIAMRLGGTTPGTYTQYNVTGTSDLSGGKVFVYDMSGNYVPHDGYMQNIIHTSGGLTGEFASNYPKSRFINATLDQKFLYRHGQTLLYPTITYNAANANVTWVQDSFRSLSGMTHNQRAVGRTLDGYASQNPGMPDGVIAYLNGQNINALPGMYNLIAPEELTAIFQMGFTAAEIQNASIERHLQMVRQESVAPTQSTRSTPDSKGVMTQETVTSPPTNRWSVFVEGTGGSANVDGNRNARGYDYDTMGVTVGADMRVSDTFVFGVLGSCGNSNANLTNGGSIDTDSFNGAIYATVYKDGFYLDALLGAGHSSYDTKRSSLLGYASGSPAGWEFNSLVNLGYDFHAGNWSFVPAASVAYTKVKLDSFTETGSLTPLSYSDQNQDSQRTELGGKIAYNAVFNGVTITPQVRMAWQHEFLDSTQTIDSRSASGVSPTFTSRGPIWTSLLYGPACGIGYPGLPRAPLLFTRPTLQLSQMPQEIPLALGKRPGIPEPTRQHPAPAARREYRDSRGSLLRSPTPDDYAFRC